jgi:ureidoglycolate lyase
LKPVNEGRGTRQDLPEARAADARADRPSTALYRLAPSPLPLRVSLLERHVLTEQVFWPLSAGRFVVVVCPSRADGSPQAEDLVAFLAEPGQALVYAAGTWHLPLAVLEQEALFAMRMWDSGSPLDCEEYTLAQPVTVVA